MHDEFFHQFLLVSLFNQLFITRLTRFHNQLQLFSDVIDSYARRGCAAAILTATILMVIVLHMCIIMM